MSDKLKTAFDDAVLKGLSAKKLNAKLRETWRMQGDQSTLAARIVEAFENKKDIDAENIVDAATFGKTGIVHVLTQVITSKDAQDFYDRALIAVAVHHMAPEAHYLQIADMLLQKGADPQAFDGAALHLANAHVSKNKIRDILEEAIDILAEKSAVAHRQPKPKH